MPQLVGGKEEPPISWNSQVINLLLFTTKYWDRKVININKKTDRITLYMIGILLYIYMGV